MKRFIRSVPWKCAVFCGLLVYFFLEFVASLRSRPRRFVHGFALAAAALGTSGCAGALVDTNLRMFYGTTVDITRISQFPTQATVVNATKLLGPTRPVTYDLGAVGSTITIRLQDYGSGYASAGFRFTAVAPDGRVGVASTEIPIYYQAGRAIVITITDQGIESCNQILCPWRWSEPPPPPVSVSRPEPVPRTVQGAFFAPTIKSATFPCV